MKYKVALAFACVTIIWSTTPLAIQWSSEDVGFIFAITSRMTIATFCCLFISRILGVPLPWDKAARQTYLAASFGIYFAMMLVYWGAQYIPSGWVAVIFGAAPMLTGLIAHKFLDESTLSLNKVLGSVIGLIGLVVIFWTSENLDQNSYYGIVAVIISTFMHIISAIWVKKVDANITPLATTTGALLFALPAYLISWFILDGELPTELPLRASLSILYLGIMGSVVGFILYFFVLQKLEASKVALITLITPVTALLLGHYFNNEVLTNQIWFGAALIMFGLIVHEFLGKTPPQLDELQINRQD